MKLAQKLLPLAVPPPPLGCQANFILADPFSLHILTLPSNRVLLTLRNEVGTGISVTNNYYPSPQNKQLNYKSFGDDIK